MSRKAPLPAGLPASHANGTDRDTKAQEGLRYLFSQNWIQNLYTFIQNSWYGPRALPHMWQPQSLGLGMLWLECCCALLGLPIGGVPLAPGFRLCGPLLASIVLLVTPPLFSLGPGELLPWPPKSRSSWPVGAARTSQQGSVLPWRLLRGAEAVLE